MNKYIILILALLATTIMCLAPNFHPEQAVLDRYYWQADVLIHSGYYFALTLLLLSLRLKIHPFLLSGALALVSYALELLQVFSFKRGVSFMDAGSNTLGIVLATGLFLLIVSRKKKRLTHNIGN